MDSSVGIQLTVVVGAIFAGFFVLYKQFIAHVEKKDKTIESMTDRFIVSNEKSHEVFTRNHQAITALTTQVTQMNHSGGEIAEALKKNSAVLGQAMNIIELHGRKDLINAVAEAKTNT